MYRIIPWHAVPYCPASYRTVPPRTIPYGTGLWPGSWLGPDPGRGPESGRKAGSGGLVVIRLTGTVKLIGEFVMAGLERDAAPGDSEARGSDGSESGSLAGADEEEEEDLFSPAGSVSSLRRQARSEGFAIAGTLNLTWTFLGTVGTGYSGVLVRIRTRARIRVDTLNTDV